MGVEHQSVFQFGFRVRLCFFRFGFFSGLLRVKKLPMWKGEKTFGMGKSYQLPCFQHVGWLDG